MCKFVANRYKYILLDIADESREDFESPPLFIAIRGGGIYAMWFFLYNFRKKKKKTCYFVFYFTDFFYLCNGKKQKLKYYGNNQYDLERCAPL